MAQRQRVSCVWESQVAAAGFFFLAGYQHQYLPLLGSPSSFFFWASFCILGGRSSGQPGIDREHVKSKFTFIASSAISHFFCVCAISGQLFWNFQNVCETSSSFLTSVTEERNRRHHSCLLFPLQFSWLFLPWLCGFHSHYIIHSVLLIECLLIHVNICYF